MSSLKPCTALLRLPPYSPPNTKLQFPLLPGMNKSVQLPCFTPGSPSPFIFSSNITCKEAKPFPPELTGRHNSLTNHLRVDLPQGRI